MNVVTAAEARRAAREAPLVDLPTLTGGSPIVVFAPHPDDETLGCGGLMTACTAAGVGVDVVLLTDGDASHPGSRDYPPAALARLRVGETTAALRVLGVSSDRLHRMGWPDAQAPTGGAAFFRAVDQLAGHVRHAGARTLFAAWGSDPHCDHAAGEAIAAAAAATTGARHLAYPVWGWTLPDAACVTAGPALRLNIETHLWAKRRAVACHHSQHGRVVTDADNAFVLPRALLRACLTPTESFFQQDPT